VAYLTLFKFRRFKHRFLRCGRSQSAFTSPPESTGTDSFLVFGVVDAPSRQYLKFKLRSCEETCEAINFLMPGTGLFLPTLYRLVGRNQLQRPAALFVGQSSQVAEKLLAAGTVAEYRQELLNWGMTNTSLNASRMLLQRILFLLMQNLMLEEEKLGLKCAVPPRFKGDTSEANVRAALTHSIVVLNSGTIWDLKEELQSWGLLHEHLNSGRLTLCILLKLSLRNLELSNLTGDDAAPSVQPVPPPAVLTPPKHQAESPVTAPAAKRLCVDISDTDAINLALSYSISPILLCAALQCASQVSSSPPDDVSSNSSQSQSSSRSQSTCVSSCSTQPRCDVAEIQLKCLPGLFGFATSDIPHGECVAFTSSASDAPALS
jgi:hypothetical protein